VAAGFSASSAQAADANSAFAPQHITVKAGTTVTWTNEDDRPDTVAQAASSSSRKRSIRKTNSRSRSRTPGTYGISALHPHMTASYRGLKRPRQAARAIMLDRPHRQGLALPWKAVDDMMAVTVTMLTKTKRGVFARPRCPT